MQTVSPDLSGSVAGGERWWRALVASTGGEHCAPLKMLVEGPGGGSLVGRKCPATDPGGVSGLDLEPFPFVTADKALSLRVAQDLFGRGIPTQLTSQAGGDARQVAGGERPMVTAGV